MEPTSNFGLRLLLLGVITAINAFFAGAEVALLSVRRPRLQQLAAEGNLGAQAALSLLGNTERMLSVVQAAISLTSLAMGVAGEETINLWLQAQLVPLAPPEYRVVVQFLCLVISFVVLTLVLVIIGEVVPKNISIVASERVSILSAPILLVVSRVLMPLVFLVEKGSVLVSRLLGLENYSGHGAHSPEEIRHIAESSAESGSLTRFEADALDRLLELRELVAREVMTPRSRMVCLPGDASLDDVLRTMSEHHFSRVPVYRGEEDNILGIVHFRDLLVVWQERRLANERRRPVRPFRLEIHIRKLPVIPETKKLSELIDEFRRDHAHMALVVNEYGGVSGVLTLEDVFEQVFGEIEDEHDLVPAAIDDDANEVELDGATPARDLEMHYGIEIPANDAYETLAGFLLFRLGAIPAGGEVVEEGGWRFIVVAMEGKRIATVRAERVAAEAAG
ncbi:MAG: hemolysin family protein [Bryobacter sp.]|nr:hemolysin family protein [Bryobacter sp.]